VEFPVVPDPTFGREGSDIRFTVSVPLGEALAGAKTPDDTVSGTVSLAEPDLPPTNWSSLS